jgi:DNA-binding NarL/FixJ family response regulator
VAAEGDGTDVGAYSSDSVNGGRWRGDSKVNGHGCVYGEPPPRDGPADIRVLVVDDHPSVRATLTELLSDEDGLTVVGECEDGSQVLEAATRLRPDVVFMDLSMKVMDGLAATGALRATQPGARVIVLTGEGSESRPAAVVAGAHALVPKGARLDALLRCLRTVAVGGKDCPYCL